VEEVDYDTFMENMMQQLRGMAPLTLGEPQIPADVSDPALPPLEEPKVTEVKKAGQMLSDRVVSSLFFSSYYRIDEPKPNIDYRCEG
jgi:hypothetical protein